MVVSNKRSQQTVREDLWQPLYNRVNYPKAFTMIDYFYLELEYGCMYTRACQRQYGDNRVDHIRRV